MVTKQASDAASAEAPREVDRIRDIIFGSQMRDYEQKFVAHHRDLERLQAELERLGQQLADLEADQAKKLQNLRQELRQADTDLRDELRQTAQRLTTDKMDRTVLGDMLIEMGNQLKSGGAFADLLPSLDEPTPQP
jgi:predicted  nucleic acid-binding Zn-ribbon protein